jgi:hypothetical protein
MGGGDRAPMRAEQPALEQGGDAVHSAAAVWTRVRPVLAVELFTLARHSAKVSLARVSVYDMIFATLYSRKLSDFQDSPAFVSRREDDPA